MHEDWSSCEGKLSRKMLLLINTDGGRHHNHLFDRAQAALLYLVRKFIAGKVSCVKTEAGVNV